MDSSLIVYQFTAHHMLRSVAAYEFNLTFNVQHMIL